MSAVVKKGIELEIAQAFAHAAQVEIECFPLWIGEGVNDGNGVGPRRIRAQIRVEPVIQIDRLGAS